jgi:hypothetical protein
MTTKQGNFGAQDLAANADVLLFTCGSGAGNTAVTATATVRFCNRTAGRPRVRLAIGPTDNIADATFMEYDTELRPNSVLENTGIALSAGERVFVRTDLAGVSVRAHGFEK